ncbi:MAG TPA: helix-turn-helix transcriptional regulator [Terrimicrobiaceae bacterium]|nr:helix-turn-helix transcriptional regulator [Terrimicrobiaceae bacterium]
MTRRARTREDAAGLIGMGNAVERLRREAGLTQGALALQAEMGRHAIGAIERGDVEATWATLRRIAAGLGVNLPYLLSLAQQLALCDGDHAGEIGPTAGVRGAHRRHPIRLQPDHPL